MISYFLRNKRQLIRHEDNLTSIAFDLFNYLPTNVFWDILIKSLIHNKLPKESGELLSEKPLFWERWDAKHTKNENGVFPDVFLRFEEFDIIVEAKYRNNIQTNGQLENEIIAYYNEYEKDDKNCIFFK